MPTNIVCVTGTHGVGKSTVIKELSQHPNVITHPAQFSRTVQRSLGYYSLTEAISHSFNKMMHFHYLVLAEMQNVFSSINDPLVYVERSPLDIISYARLWSKRYFMGASPEICEPALQELRDEVWELMSHVKSMKVILRNSDISFEHDANRGSEETSDLYEDILLEECSRYANTNPELRLIYISSSDINTRVAQCLL